MARTDDNAARGVRRALTAAFVAVVSVGGCGVATDPAIQVDLVVRFENTLDSYYWMEVGPRRGVTTSWFQVYPMGTHVDTLQGVTPGNQVFVEMTYPGAAGLPQQRWEKSCIVGSTGFAAREATVRIEIQSNIPALTCVGW